MWGSSWGGGVEECDALLSWSANCLEPTSKGYKCEGRCHPRSQQSSYTKSPLTSYFLGDTHHSWQTSSGVAPPHTLPCGGGRALHKPDVHRHNLRARARHYGAKHTYTLYSTTHTTSSQSCQCAVASQRAALLVLVSTTLLAPWRGHESSSACALLPHEANPHGRSRLAHQSPGR